ncbi:response regulator [Oceanospirillum sediminis]|uniref:Response regulator n=1 Tax=Oceanospirillum sediminis TaxID=2760088 RepID=A0A839IN37_9GAMM|nr:response regulator [Oceanospirillum sediminis]MBB1486635.1 response regulator [Oceanospirillum sediminis]
MNKTVLVVDDSKVSRMMMTRVITEKDADWQVIEAENGQKAIEMGLEFAPNLIIMDVNMPVMDGFQAAENLRPKLPDTTFIMLTANVQASSKQRAEELGVHFIAKPITPSVAEQALTIWGEEHEGSERS